MSRTKKLANKSIKTIILLCLPLLLLMDKFYKPRVKIRGKIMRALFFLRQSVFAGRLTIE